jgi:hypothetical protein
MGGWVLATPAMPRGERGGLLELSADCGIASWSHVAKDLFLFGARLKM